MGCSFSTTCPPYQLRNIFSKIHQALKSKEIFFTSFKYGEGEVSQEGRTFYYQTQESIFPDLNSLFEIIEIWTAQDSRASRSE